ncbi:AbrB/MazE/SpoVT family DNA-binding domain-containing protein [Metabacillus herbersteinensis]|uniref:AbrB/MazE/SpoVT family DNA-binding domain-containing protein n=1 Tax=Metabacillus herbersteinensis TaxID=283816 RepID=A0ABV6GMV6_9BACI
MHKLRLGKTGQIYIPTRIRKEIDFELGDLINIILDGENLILSNKDGYEEENKCVISQGGFVHIPTEIRRFSNFSEEDVFKVILDKKEKQLNLILDVKIPV